MLKNKIAQLPDNPGCYLMKNSSSDVIYVGKAKNLKNRVSSYFKGAHDYKTTKLVSNIADFDYIVTNNEKEALILESNLIKKHRPIYNILLLDDKSYPYIKISNEKYPTVTVVRESKKDNKALYFGPYPKSTNANLIVNIINELFPLKKCRKMPKKTCLYYHLRQCLGMCEYQISNDVYQNMLVEIKALLKNNQKDLVTLLESRMQEASLSERYEIAQKYKNNLEALKDVATRQGVQTIKMVDSDIVNYAISHGFIAFQVLMIRENMLLDKIVRVYSYYGNLQDDFQSFISQYLKIRMNDVKTIVPNEIDISNFENISSYKKSKYDYLLDLAAKNAKIAIYQKVDLSDGKLKIIENGIRELEEILKVKLSRIEMFDNSHLSGTNNVSAMVVNQSGVFTKKDYRLYNLDKYRSDLDSFKEVVYRRFLKAKSEKNNHPCDLLVMDGGFQQVKVAKEIRDALYLDFKIIGLSKDDKHQTSKVIDEQGNKLNVNKSQDAFLFLSQLQDEAHRFAITFQKKKRSKAMTFSLLDDCPMIGESRKEIILNNYKNIKEVQKATINELQDLLGEKVGEALYKHLRN